jgi:hypothetical protein
MLHQQPFRLHLVRGGAHQGDALLDPPSAQ